MASRYVGFEIYNLGKNSDKDFDLRLLLWGRGGPNWEFEERKYYLEQEAEWNHVKNTNNKAAGKISVFKRLSFLANLAPVTPPTVSSNLGSYKSINSINSGNAFIERKSYAQVVNGGNRISDPINSNSMPRQNFDSMQEIWVKKGQNSFITRPPSFHAIQIFPCS
jgi:hypothetical protein